MLKVLDKRAAMKIGYGFKRTEQSFRQYGCEQVWIDQTDARLELSYMLGADGKTPAFREGDTLVLLQHSDIGDHWKSRRRVLVWLAERGIPVQVRDQEPVLYDTEEKLAAFKAQNGGSKTQIDGGAPSKVKWTKEKAERFAAAWYGPFSRAYVAAEFKDITGRKFDGKAVNNCNYFFGPRDGSRKDRYLALVGE